MMTEVAVKNELEFKEIVLKQNDAVDQSVLLLIEEALGGKRDLKEFLERIDYAAGNSIVLGAYVGDHLACMSVYIRTAFDHQGDQVIGFQTGFSVASKTFRGKGSWPALMRFAFKYLHEHHQSSFTYGFPNKVSFPVTVKRLQFTPYPMHRVRISPAAMWSKAQFNFDVYKSRPNALRPVMDANLAWKRREYGADAFREYSFKNARVWGRRRTTEKRGIHIPYFDMGGIELGDARELQGLLRRIFLKERVAFCTLSLNEGHEYFPLFNSTNLEEEPLVIKTYSDLAVNDIPLNFYSGMRDTF